MILFFSDIHFGHGEPSIQRSTEHELVACLVALEKEVSQLILMGDVFEAWIEYRSMIPKGFVRFQGLLASWTDRGIPVTYLVGNHDPWHRDYFEKELGVEVIFNPTVRTLGNRQIYLAHGDGQCPTAKKYNLLKPVLRHRLPVWLYTHLLPGDLGMQIAQWVSKRFGSNVLIMETVYDLRDHAREVLKTQPVEGVVMGHCHYPELTSSDEKWYLNPGAWYETQTFGRLDASGPRLMKWNGTSAEAYLSNPPKQAPAGLI